ncbi:MAG: ferrous iron transport protein A [Candidatus Thorarchaeota archaeon]|nr:ferrous iron transport protein A [Candidatus Thorarchaeota archaeon]
MNSITAETSVSVTEQKPDRLRLTSIKTSEECIILEIVDHRDTEIFPDSDREGCKIGRRRHGWRRRSHHRPLRWSHRHHHHHQHNVRCRLLDMGLVPGTRVKVINNQNRGPILVEVRDSKMALGRGLASKILVYKIG